MYEYPCISSKANTSLKYSAWNGSSWSLETAEQGSVSYYVGYETSLCIKSTNLPVIAYQIEILEEVPIYTMQKD
jgi:hypothetical protein